MANAGPQHFRLGDLSYGLMTKDAPTAIPHGALSQALNLRLDAGRLGSGMGFNRFTSLAPNDSTIKLNGNSNFFRGKITATTNLMALASNDLTFEFVFRTDTFRSYQVLFHKGVGSATLPAGAGGTPADDFVFSNTDYAIYLRPNTTNGKLALYMWRFTTGAAVESIPFGDLVTPLEIVPGAYYHAVVVRDNSGPLWHLYVHQVGTALGAGSVSTAGVKSATTNDTAYDVTIGGMTNIKFAVGRAARDQDVLHGTFQGVIQEIRRWSDVRTTPELEALDDRQLTTTEVADASLVAYYPLLTSTATARYFFSPSKGTAGGGAGLTPILELRPSGMTWVSSSNTLFGSPLVGSASGRIDGRDGGLIVTDSYRYLSGTKGGDNQLQHREQYIIAARVKPLAPSGGQTIFHWTNVPDDAFTSTALPLALAGAGASAVENPATSQSIIRLIIQNVGAGVLEYTAILWVDDAGTKKAFSVTSATGGIVAGQAYAITMSYSKSANTWTLNVDALAAVTAALPAGHAILATPDDPDGSLYKYWMTIGRAIKQVRFSNTNTFDPNGVDVEYDFIGTFDGVVDQLLICGEAIQNSGPYVTPTDAFHAYLASREITRENVNSLQSIVLSAWPFEDASGDQITDIGDLGNHIIFHEDPGHTHGRSGISTNKKLPFRFLGDHFYRSATGGVRMTVGIGGGTLYELVGGVTVTPICDGFRNDDDNLISGARYLDGLILCCGGKGGNYHLFERNLYKLTIEPPSGVIPFGLEDQINPKAALFKGIYKYLFTFYSSFTGKRSPVGSQVVVEIKTRKANVLFGLDSEMNQTYPTTGKSDNKEAFDISATANVKMRFAGWYGTADHTGIAALNAGGPVNVTTTIGTQDWWEAQPIQGTTAARRAKKLRAFLQKAIGTTNAFIHDNEAVDTDEIVKAVEEKSWDRVFAEANEDGTFTLKGCVAGGEYNDGSGGAPGGIFFGAYLWAADVAGAAATLQNAGVIDLNVAAPAAANGGTNYTGTGIKGHGIRLPYSPDPQVTHLEIWRTLADDDTYRLVARVENGTPSWKDSTTDADLTGEILDTTIAAPPAVRYVAQLGPNTLFLSPSDNPQRAYFSDPALPWSVPATNVVDFLDGSTLALTGAASVNGLLAVFKADTVFILTPPSNQFLPFDIQVRYKDAGCLSHFGIVQFNNGLVFPGERGFYAYDGNSIEYLSDVIQPTWLAFPGTYKPRIAGFWDRTSDTCVWGLTSTASFAADGVGRVPDFAASWCTTAPRVQDGPTGWMPLSGLQISYAATIQDASLNRRVLFADEYGNTFEWNPAGGATNYGVGTLTPRVVTVAVSNTASTFSIPKVSSYATLPGGYRGMFLTWQNAAGTIRETRQIISDDLGSPNAVIVLDHALSGIPQVGDSVAVGSIEATGTFGQISPGGPEGIHEWTEAYIRADKQTTPGSFEFAWQGLGGVNHVYQQQEPPFSVFHAEDQVTLSNQEVDMYWSLGHSARGARLCARIRALGADKPFRIRDMSWLVRPPAQREFQTGPVRGA